MSLDHRYYQALCIIGLCVFCAFFGQSLLIPQTHDWDIEALLYLGSRLDAGELLYTADFETKLPALQYFSWLAYRLGGIGAWRLIVGAVCLACCFVATRLLLSSLLTREGRSMEIAAGVRTVACALALLVALGFHAQPNGDSGQLSTVSGSLIFLSIALIHHRVLANGGRLCLIGAGVAAALAFSIRPNYLFVLPGLVVLHHLLAHGGRETRLNEFQDLALLALAMASAAALQFLPYLADERSARILWDALLALGSFSMGFSLKTVFLSQLGRVSVLGSDNALGFYEALLIYLALACMWSAWPLTPGWLRSRLWRGVLGVVICLVLLEVQILWKHYWPHYSGMFVPFFAVLVIYVSAAALHMRAQSGAISWTREPMRALFIMISATSLTAIFGVYGDGQVILRTRNMALEAPLTSLAINDRLFDHKLLEGLAAMRRQGLSFYKPQHTVYHRLLQHPRAGDGHQAMAIFVLQGGAFRPLEHLPLFSRASFDDRCHAVRTLDKDVIVLGRERDPNLIGDLDGPVEACLQHAPRFRQSTFAAFMPANTPNTAYLDANYILFHRVGARAKP